MTETSYASLNVTVRIHEEEFLDKSDYQALLSAKNLEDAIAQLQHSAYRIPDDILSSRDFDGFLIDRLMQAMQEVYQNIPDQKVVDLLGLRYSYHNAKIIFKELFSDQDFHHMYLPAGPYQIDSLRQAIKTGKSSVIDQRMLEAINTVRTYVEDTKQINDISVMLDDAYLSHIHYLALAIDDDQVTEWVALRIDLENLSLLLRAMQQKRSSSFIRSLLNEHGSIPLSSLLEWAENKDYSSIFKAYEVKDYGEHFSQVLSETESELSNQDRISLDGLDAAIEGVISDHLRDARLQAFGPLPVLAYLYFLNNEVTNLRLILVGKSNQIDENKLKERMRPIYDE
ncbi:V-type ATPase subunit [Aerococcus mictus]|uniref:V-type ATPase subunit n=1 Tax=Aerococcus mictus TaxID=2976810 RepID=UPI00227C1F33|nr:V-type ATPase subunit [Aerococcus mictus]MCY3081139.1 V-type ATPase subunit [Aerococcus mictus]